MATIQQLSEALQNAHAAGDVAAAQQLAQTLQQIQQQQGASPQPQVAPGSLPSIKVDRSQDADLSAGRVGSLIKSGAYDFVSNTADAVATGLDQYYGDQFQGAEDIARGIQEDFEIKQRVAIKPLLEAEGMADVGQSTLEYLAQSSPEMAAVMGGYAAGSRATSPLRKIPRFGKILNFMGGLTGGTVAAVGSFTGRNLDEFRQVQGREPTKDEMDNVVGTAVVQSALNSALAPLVMAGRGGGSMTIEVVKRALQGTALEGSTEAAQEVLSVLQANNFDPNSLDDPETVYRLKESFLAGMAVGGPISAASGVRTVTKPTANEDAANATLAQRLDQIASANGYNLKDIDKMSTEGARETVDAAHIQIAEELKQLRAELKTRLQVDARGIDDFDTVMDKIEAAVAFRQARNKTKSRVGQQEYDAVERLVGNTFEGQQILKKFREMNALTKLHNDGYQGGLSKFTDQFGIFGSGIGYDKSVVAMERLARPVLSGGLALQTGGASLAGQAAAQATGRAVDAVTGRRSRVDRFVNQNVGGDPINVSPFEFPSVRTQRQMEQAALEEEEASLDPRDAPMGWRNVLFGQLQQSRANMGLPSIVFDNSDIDQAVSELREEGALSEQDLADINKPAGGRISNLALRKITNRVNRNTRDRPPSPQQSTPAPNLEQQTRDAAREAAIQRGIEDNRRALDGLNEQVQNDNDMSKADKAKILAAMQEMRLDLGRDPMGKLQRIMRDLLTSGVPQPLVEKYVQPYVARVLEQQRQNRRGGGDDISTEEARVMPVRQADLINQERYGVDPVLPGGNYIDLDSVGTDSPSDITGNTYETGTLKITPEGRPDFVTSDNQTDSILDSRKDGPRVTVNLAKSKTGWKWVEAPETGSPETIVSIKRDGKHFYALGADFNNPVTLKTYPNDPSEPRLKPSTKGELKLGKKVGSIKMRDKIHPVYEVVSIGQPSENNVTIDANLQFAPPTFDGPTPTVQGQSQQAGNKHGLNPHLRVETTVPEGRDKPLFTQKTNNKNAPAQIENIDTILERHPDALESPEAFTAMLADALASDDVPVPPFKLIEDINGEGSFELLNNLTPGQLADANTGFENAAAFREAYLNGEVDVSDTGKLFFWSFLSRGISPYVQESMFLDAYYEIDKWIQDAANGTFNLKAYLKWAEGVAPQGSGLPGAGGKSNLNAFGKDFLIKMSQDAGLGDGRSRLQVIHDMMSDPNSTAKEIRRQFLRMGEGVGIDNKVVSFTLLVAGYPDVMVLDRVQLRNMFNDGRFGDINLWDGIKVDGKVVTGSTLASLTYGARGLLVYEAIEQALQSRLANLYGRLGRPQNASVGRYHWETWVASSGQEASHDTINAILSEVGGSENPILNIRSKEGEYGRLAYGARYGFDTDGASFIYSIPDRGTFKFTVPKFQTFLKEITKRSNGVLKKGFIGVDAAGKQGGPWYNNENVDKDALRVEAVKYGKEIEEDSDPEAGEQVRSTDGTNGTNQDVSTRSSADQPDAPLQEDQGVLTDLMAVDPAQMEFDLDVQSIPQTPTSETGAAQRAVKETLDEANALIEIGKPGSKYENGIKTQEQLESLATALGIMDKLVFVDSFADMRRKYESMTGGNPNRIKNGTMGITAQGQNGEILAVLILKEGKGGKNFKQDQEFVTAVHEVAHVIEQSKLSDAPQEFIETGYTRPYKLDYYRMFSSSFRNYLNRHLTNLGRDKRNFDDDPIVKEIRAIQMNETVTQPDGSQGPIRPSLQSAEEFGQIWDEYFRRADSDKRARMKTRDNFINSALVRQRQRQESYYENAAEFSVDPLIFALMEPKRAKEQYPNVYKFIQDTFSGKNFPIGNVDAAYFADGEPVKSTSPLRFYTNPFSVILAAVLSAMAMSEEDEERRQPPMMPPGALTPQRGALTL